MAGDVKKLVVQGKTFWSGLSKRRKMVLISAILGTIGLVLYLSLRGSVVSYEVLYAGLQQKDGDSIEAELKRMGIPYLRESGGAVLKVPQERVAEVRVALAGEGFPKSGIGFEIFDKQDFGATGFVEQMKYKRALEGELKRTIEGLDVVESARVHLAIPERSLFRDEGAVPSASVVVKLYTGRALSPAQVRGILNLVANAVPQLTAENVSLADDTGRVLSEGQTGTGLATQSELEATLTRRALEILEPWVGEGHAEVQITAEMDFTKEETRQELFDKENAVIKSEHRSEDWTGGAVGGIAGGLAGARGNAPGAPAPGAGTAPAGGSAGKLDETKNYEISKTVQVKQGASAKLKRLNVAILIDGIDDPNFKPEEEAAEQEKGKEKEKAKKGAKKEEAAEEKKPVVVPRVPRSAEELAKLANLVKPAVGFDESRGDKFEIQSAVFAAGPPLEPEKPVAGDWPAWTKSPRNQLLLKAGGLLFLILSGFGALLVLIRAFRLRAQDEAVLLASLPRNVRDIEAELASGGTAAQLGPGAAAALPAPKEPPKPREIVAETAKKDLVRTVRVISNWLGESAGEAKGES